MKKKSKNLLFVLLALVFLTGCIGNVEIENVLIGTWKHMNYNTGDWEKVIFNENLTYRLENYNGTTYSTAVVTGKYTFDEEKFIFERPGLDNIAFYYTITGDNLYILYGKTYIRQ